MLSLFALHLVVVAASATPAVAPSLAPFVVPMGVPRLDTLVKVARGTRLELEAGQVPGQIQLRSWDRDEVSVSGPTNARVSVQGRTVRVTESAPQPARGRATNRAANGNRSALGPNGRNAAARSRDSVNWQVMVPKWMALEISADQADVSVQGAGSSVEVEAVGSVSVVGGVGRVVATSLAGSVTVEGARASVTVDATSGRVRLTDVAGDIVRVQSINGAVQLERVDARNLSATSFNAQLEFDGTIRDDGRYQLESHNGRIRVTLPDKANVTVVASTYGGAFQNAFASRGGSANGREQRFSMGNGSARLEVTSFNGNVEFVRSAGR